MTDTYEDGSFNLHASPIKQPLTLDDVSKRIDKICTDYFENVKRVKAEYDTGLEALSADLDASPELDQDAAISIVMGRCKRMLSEMSQGFVG